MRRIPAGPEVGLVAIRPRVGDEHHGPLLGGVARDAQALAWHWWEVGDLPSSYQGRSVEVIACSDRCGVQAFAVGERVWGMQFHLEARARTARTWATSDPARLQAVSVDPERLVVDVAEAEDALVRTWSAVIDAWIAALSGPARRVRLASRDEQAG